MNDTPSTPESSDEAAAVQQWADKFNNLRDELKKVIVGQDDVIEQILIAMVARGHALLEGVPGGKATESKNTVSHYKGSDMVVSSKVGVFL